MPFKDKEKQKKANRNRMKIVRQGNTLGNTNGNTLSGNTGQGNTEVPAIVRAIADPERRKKLERVCQSLKDFNQLENVYYGHPYKGISFTVVSELLEATG